MNRRSVLGLFAALGAGAGGTFLIQNGGDVDNTISDAQDLASSADSNENATAETPEPESGRTEFGRFSNGFEAAEWTADHQLAVTVADDHDMDALGVRYHAKSSIEDDLVVQTAPEYGGTVEFDVLAEMAELESRPPVGEYQLVAYKGEFGGVFNIADETVGSVSLQIEPDLDVVGASTDEDGRVTVEVQNTGNAPATLVAADVNGERAEFESVLPVGQTAAVSTNRPFENDGCVQRPTELAVSLETGPRVEAEGEFGGVETTEKCAISIG